MAVYHLDPRAQQRLDDFVDGIGDILRHKKKRAGFAAYLYGLVADGERKSVEPIAARVCPDPAKVSAMHFKLLHFITNEGWDDAPVRSFAVSYALEALQQHHPIEAWIVDDTGFLKKGDKSPGVQRQYTGSAGKITNCQIGVSLSYATCAAHVLGDFRLYMPKSWTEDRERCRQAHVPDHVEYRPKWRLALDMIEAAVEEGRPQGVVLADADYGNRSAFRDRLDDLGLPYSVGIHDNTTVHRVRGRSRRRLDPATTVFEVAFQLRASDFRRVTWVHGTQGKLSSKFAVLRVEVAHDDGRGRPEQWLIIEWPDGAAKPTKYILSTMPKGASRKQLVRMFKARWRTERIYQDCKGRLGLDHYEGRSFVGWHHHVSVVICCYAFAVAEQAGSFFPSAAGARRRSALRNAA